MNTTLEELATEYEHSIKIQNDIIEINRKKLLAAQRKGNFNEVKRLSTLLRILYDEKSDMEKKAKTLKNYYS